ncbi:DUF1569 domain-containing protein [Mucilaginibacter sp. dw_454]|uniref:DUF1569 domain-containing protein n=1 Tax=Mucilaginibacter sp. dw_454 TaxID=2720079 RepID=UPI001BD3C042|nr:DUF1569 domain-containing protein [Mucilaginibacter sp. dw_454]
MKSVFNPADVIELIYRVNKLTPDTQPLWGKMAVGQMLAHVNVSYEMVFTDKHPRPNAFARVIIKLFVKSAVVGPKPYKRNSPTAPAFLIKEDKNFDIEKTRLLSHLNQTQQLGEEYFHNKRSHSFGKLTAAEWNVMFYKHLDHHLTQFGV